MSAMNDGQWVKLAQAIGKPEWATHSKFATNKARVKNRVELISALNNVFSGTTRAEWLQPLADAGLPVAPVNTVKEALAEEQVVSRGMVQEVEHSSPDVGTIRVTGVPVKFSDDVTDVRMPPPALGEHTEEVLRDVLGYTVDDIKEAQDGGWV